MLTSILIAVGVCFGVAACLGLAIALADKYFKVVEDPRIGEVTNMLPGANCGGCGFAGCSGFASSIVNKETPSLAPCKVTKPDQKKKIQEYLASNPGPDGTTIDVKIA